MERFAPLLLDVWREIGRHIEIGDALERIAPLLARRLPVDRAAGAPARPGARERSRRRRPRRQLDERRATRSPRRSLQELAAWCRRGRPARGCARRRSRERLPGPDPDDVDGDVLVGPAAGASDEPTRARSCSSRDRRAASSASTRRCSRALLEPFTRRARERPAASPSSTALRAGGRGRPPVAARAARPPGPAGDHRRRRDGPAREHGAHRAGRALRRAGAAARRDRLGQGGRRARDPRALARAPAGRSCA